MNDFLVGCKELVQHGLIDFSLFNLGLGLLVFRPVLQELYSAISGGNYYDKSKDLPRFHFFQPPVKKFNQHVAYVGNALGRPFADFEIQQEKFFFL